MRVLIFSRDIFRKFPFLLIANILLLVVVSLVGAASMFALAPVVDFLINPDLQGVSRLTQQAVAMMESIGVPATMGGMLAAFLVLNVLKAGLDIFARYFILRTKYAVLRDLMLGTFEDFFRARWCFFGSAKQGTLLNTFMRELTVVGDAFGAMGLFFANIIQVILYLAVPFYLSWQVTTISLTVALLFAWPFLLLGRVTYRLGRLTTSAANQIGAVIQESLSMAKLLLGFGNQHKSVEALGRAFDVHCQTTIKSQTLSIAIPIIFFPLGLLVVTIALFVARKLAVPLSETAVLLYAFLRIIPSIGQLGEQKNSLDNFFPSYEQVINLRHRAKELEQQTGTRIFKGFNREVVIEELSFAHPGHEPILVDVNMRIPKGHMIALVGESGAGKSTVIDMIMGFNEPMTGRITLDGVPLHDFDINSYRQRIGYVPQDSVLFNMTIRDNLRWAHESATDEEIGQACRLANAHEFIKEFPQRYDTLVGDRGVRLSGGQILAGRPSLGHPAKVKPPDPG